MVVAVKLFLVVALLLVAAQCQTISVSSPRPRRSPKWDAFMEGLRQKRQVNDDPCMPYYSGSCPISDVTQFDTLGRRNSGLLADVQFQGSCGNCWAFAAVHTYTDFMSIQMGQKKDLVSPRYLTECGKTRLGNGCCGGNGVRAAKHFLTTGAVTEQCLPYSDTLQKYDRRKKNPLMCPNMCSVSGSTYNPSSLKAPEGTYRCIMINESIPDSTIIDLLNQQTVVNAGMRVDMRLKEKYKCGVHTYQPESEEESLGNHSVEIVDYGTTDTGCDFWVIKNSWGTKWGESGYFRLRRGDLEIQSLFLVYPLPENTPITYGTKISDSSTTVDMQTCAPEEVENPSQDTMLQAAAEVGLEELVQLQVITCPGSSDIIEGLTLNDIVSGTEQIVAGVSITVTVCADVQGCGNNDIITIEMGINVDLDGAFSLTDYDFEFGGVTCGGSNLCFACLLLFLLLAIAVLVINNTV